jgi:hypothetical protein
MLRTLIIKKFKGQQKMLENMSKTSSSTKGTMKVVRQHWKILKDSKIIYLFIHSNDDEETLGY